jgi:thiol-disulfide isomerase/thioredoxin
MRRLKLLLTTFLCCLLLTSAHANAVLTDIRGEKIPFANLKGKWVLINYWASWCRPCLDEIQELNRFYQARKDDVVLYAVNFDSLPVQDQLQLIKSLDIRYPSLAKDPGQQLGLGNVRGVPATFVFDPNGNLSTTLYGGQTISSLNEAIHTTT